MPTYRYRCDKDGEEFELWQSIHDDALTTHPGCGGTVTKVFAPAGIVLKGSGFYRTDSRAGSRPGGSGEPKKEGAGSGGNGAGESKSSDSSGSSGSSESSGSNSGGSTESKGSKESKPSKSGGSST